MLGLGPLREHPALPGAPEGKSGRPGASSEHVALPGASEGTFLLAWSLKRNSLLGVEPLSGHSAWPGTLLRLN